MREVANANLLSWKTKEREKLGGHVNPTPPSIRTRTKKRIANLPHTSTLSPLALEKFFYCDQNMDGTSCVFR